MRDYGIKVAPAGSEATTRGQMTAGGLAPDFSTILFSSSFFVYKVLVGGTISYDVPSTLPANSRLDTLTVAHGLGYTPMVVLYFSVDGGTTWFGNNCETEGSTTGQPIRTALGGADSTNIIINVVSSELAAYSLSCRFFALAEVGS